MNIQKTGNLNMNSSRVERQRETQKKTVGKFGRIAAAAAAAMASEGKSKD